MNAFAVGRPEDAAIAVTDGLLRRLTLRELVGVLAHEVSHIRNDDLWIMGLADVIGRLTGAMSMAGMVLLLANLPLLDTSKNRPGVASGGL
jgi:heat shock protein HtpX